jgi:hypothetical protein
MEEREINVDTDAELQAEFEDAFFSCSGPTRLHITMAGRSWTAELGTRSHDEELELLQ